MAAAWSFRPDRTRLVSGSDLSNRRRRGRWRARTARSIRSGRRTGRSIGFAADGVLKRIDLDSGLVRTLASRAPAGGAWSADGTILIGSIIGPLYSIQEEGGATRGSHTLAARAEQSSLAAVPARRPAVPAVHAWDRPTSEGCIADPRPTRTWNEYRIENPVTGSCRLRTCCSPGKARCGHGRVNREHTRVEGEFVLVAPEVLVHRGVYGYAAFSTSSTGSIAYRASAGETQLVWVDRTGRPAGAVGTPDDSQLSLERLSTDGRTIAAGRTVAGNSNVWLFDTQRGAPHRVDVRCDRRPQPSSRPTAAVSCIRPRDHVTGRWSTNGGRTARETRRWCSRNPSTSGTSPRTGLPTGVISSIESRRRPAPICGPCLSLVNGNRSTSRRHRSRNRTPASRQTAARSPMRRMRLDRTRSTCSLSREPGQSCECPSGGGTIPRWRQDGRELFYLAPDRRLMVVSVSRRGSESRDGTSPRPVHAVDDVSVMSRHPTVSGFSSRAVISAASPIVVILNWKPPGQ